MPSSQDQEPTHVYELDTDQLMSRIQDRLSEAGNEVVEQVPSGVWWVRTSKSQAEMCGEITNLVQSLCSDALREVS